MENNFQIDVQVMVLTSFSKNLIMFQSKNLTTHQFQFSACFVFNFALDFVLINLALGFNFNLLKTSLYTYFHQLFAFFVEESCLQLPTFEHFGSCHYQQDLNGHCQHICFFFILIYCPHYFLQQPKLFLQNFNLIV